MDTMNKKWIRFAPSYYHAVSLSAILLLLTAGCREHENCVQISGVVIDTAGMPVFPASIHFLSDGMPVPVDSSGAFSFSSDGRRFPDTIVIRAVGYCWQWRAIPACESMINITLANAVCPAFPLTPDTANPFDPQFRVIFPNGGEVFHIGEVCTVRIDAHFADNGQLSLAIQGLDAFELPGVTESPMIDSGFSVVFVIPADIRGNSLISDSCAIIVRQYNGIAADQSDCYFQIKP